MKRIILMSIMIGKITMNKILMSAVLILCIGHGGPVLSQGYSHGNNSILGYQAAEEKSRVRKRALQKEFLAWLNDMLTSEIKLTAKDVRNQRYRVANGDPWKMSDLLAYGSDKAIASSHNKRLLRRLTTKTNSSTNDIQSRLAKLKKLEDAGLITKEEAAEKRKAILDSL
jgi:hypothetical protein